MPGLSSAARALHQTQPSPWNGTPACAEGLLEQMLMSSLVLREDWEALPGPARDRLLAARDPYQLVDALAEHGLLTEYQADRVRAGKAFGLVLGNYRVLERLGAGGMGVVFKAEHVRLRRPVAVKVLSLSLEQTGGALARFDGEIRAVARLRHPNIVAAIDAGELPYPEPERGTLHYFVMEFVPGEDLEAHVKAHGPLPPERACDLAYQVASALAEAHKHGLVHRDLKPSNVLVTPDGQAKLLDFGLARQFDHRLTEPGSMMGTIEYMAPEQARDASQVDIRADLFALGGTLFWCLTGRGPFPPEGSLAEELARRQVQPPPSAHALRPEVPPALDAVLARLMACRPEERFPNPRAVMNALVPFLTAGEGGPPPASPADGPAAAAWKPQAGPRPWRVLVVDDESSVRLMCRLALTSEQVVCAEAANGAEALAAVAAHPPDLLLLDLAMPGMGGREVCRRLRESPSGRHLKVILFSGHASGDELSAALSAGADDFLTKPFSVVQLRARVQAALRLKDAQDGGDRLNRHLVALNQELEQHLTARDRELAGVRGALVLALTGLLQARQVETPAHLLRMQRFSRCLAEEAAGLPAFAGRIDGDFVQGLDACVPLHDLGKVALPDHLLLKPGRLDDDERLLMHTHALTGAELLAEVARRHGEALPFLHMAIDIARHHHERWDGSGYPDGLAGEAIPLAARLVAVADVYDALRSRRVYKPALSHGAATRLILASDGQFDPALLEAFGRCQHLFERFFQELAD
ncbi:MAG TPA: response regulator [Gemmataceae bacterium]|nr:response regulator [Gemmataceae bacterium]